MSKRKGPPIAEVYAAPGFRRPGVKSDKDAYPHCYEEDEAAPEKKGEVFKCVYASPEWFASHHGLHNESETRPKYCPRCGAAVLEGANFCINCGLDLRGETEV